MPKEDTQFKSGDEWTGNKAGRPKGKTMKEFARDFLMAMDDKAKQKFLKFLLERIS